MQDISQGNHLYLYCTDLEYFPDDFTAFIESCQNMGLIGKTSPNHDVNHYLVGDDFLQYISFLGCSPYLKVWPEDENDTDYCSVFIANESRPIHFLAGQHVTTPRCPDCKKAMQSGFNVLKEWQHERINKTIECEHCGKTSSLFELDWRKNAGFFNFALAISNIYPKEAIPSEGLLAWLQQISGCEWRYFYA